MSNTSLLGSYGGQAGDGLLFRNRIVNGDMRIDQRNSGAAVTITSTAANTYVIDRFFGYCTSASKFSLQRNAGAVALPTGFINYLGATSLSAYAVGVNDEFVLGQAIEGFNAADFAWGTANAQTVSLSFWVRSSLTGTFGGSIRNSSVNRSYIFTYSISVANTWEYKTVVIPGDTSGTWLTDNTVGLYLTFCVGAGSSRSTTAGSWQAGNFVQATGATSVVGTNGATLYLTGVQLESGTATPFERRPYSVELGMCQRYYEIIGSTTTAQVLFVDGNAPVAGHNTVINYSFKQTKRTASNIIQIVGNSWSNVNCNNSGAPTSLFVGLDTVAIGFQSTSTGRYYSLNNAGTYLVANAEL